MKTLCAKALSSILVLISTVAVTIGMPAASMAVAVPRLIVTESRISGGSVKAGDDFEMIIHMKNESKSKLSNIKMELSSENNEIVPKSGANSLYVNEIDKEAEIDIAVDMTTRSDLIPSNYSVSLKYVYEDNDWRFFEDEAELTVPVYQIPELSVTEMKLARESTVIDGKTTCSFKINNTGKCDIYNVRVSVSGENIKTVDSFIGKLAIDSSYDADLLIKSVEVGTKDVVAEVSFEDVDGNVYSAKSAVPLEVTEPVVLDIVEETPIYMQPVAWIAGGAVLLVIIVVCVIRKKREKKYA